MGLKARLRYYIVWLENSTDRQDDEPIKVKARSRDEARKEASNHTRGRFFIGQVFTLSEFRQYDSWWADHFIGKKAVNE